MAALNDWHDYVRLVAFFVSLFCVFTLVARYFKEGAGWSTQMHDYWFALLMWSLAGSAFTVQGVLLDRSFTPGFVFLTAAIFVTGKLLNASRR